MKQPRIRVAQALLFDMDGTLVLSHAVVHRVWGRWAERHRLDPGHVIAESHGRRTIDSVRALCPPGVDQQAEADELILAERLDTEGIVAVPGVLALLRSVPPERWAVVTSADRPLAEVRLRAAGITPPRVCITAEDVTHGKPDPQGYLLAASRLGVPAADCIVFEDAPAGIAAGRAAGAHVIVLATEQTPEAVQDDDWIADYTGLSARIAADGSLALE